jgi:hypothetical protein
MGSATVPQPVNPAQIVAAFTSCVIANNDAANTVTVTSPTMTDSQVQAALAAIVYDPSIQGPSQNVATIEANIRTHLGQIETWLVANPNGAVLNAQQTAFLARMIVGLGRVVLGLVTTVGQA